MTYKVVGPRPGNGPEQMRHAAELDEYVIQLRESGELWKNIARLLQVSEERARQRYFRGLKRRQEAQAQ